MLCVCFYVLGVGFELYCLGLWMVLFCVCDVFLKWSVLGVC